VVPLSHVKAIIIQTRYPRFAIVIKLARKDLRGYHLLWPDLPTFSEFLEEGFPPFPLLQVLPRTGPGKAGVPLSGPLPLSLPNPLSLAATNGVSVDFLSFSYNDVSVR
jgi:hypothetical protein